MRSGSSAALTKFSDECSGLVDPSVQSRKYSFIAIGWEYVARLLDRGWRAGAEEQGAVMILLVTPVLADR